MQTEAPFDAEQIYSLLQWQRSTEVHPYTCFNDKHENSVVLQPLKGGLRCPECGHLQKWVHDFSLTRFPREKPLPVNVQVTSIRYSALPPGHRDSFHFEVVVQYRGDDRWAVMRGAECWSRSKEQFHYERIPSDRDEEWLADHRFTLEEAQQLACKIAPQLTVNGWTVDAVLARDAEDVDA